MIDENKEKLQAQFNERYLALTNALSGNPITLLRNSDAQENILKAGEALADMLAIAKEYHPAESENEKTDSSEK
ncbi:hypothetical protein ACPV36_04895 [Photobacterium damselae]|uniref:hypothetical protein n=1 Tax=Photobacterium damselae TaxID=38293 RepID=UPI004067CEC2